LSEISVAQYERGDEVELVGLLGKVFGKWPQQSACSPVEHWRWKYLRNPQADNFIVLARDSERLVGCFHSVPMLIKIGEGIYSSSTGTDLGVDPEYRNRGISNKMRKLQRSLERKSVAFHYGVTSNPILLEKYRREKQGNLPYPPYIYVRIDDIELHRSQSEEIPLHEWYGMKALKALNKIGNLGYRLKQGNIKVREVQRFGDEVDAFWGKVQGGYSFIVVRSREYLNWRYCDPSCGDYTVMEAVEGNEMLGYVVIRIVRVKEDYHYGYIVDLLTLPRGEDVAINLVSEAVDLFKSKEVNLMLWQITGRHPHARIASRFGFLNTRRVNILDYPKETTCIGSDEERMQKSLPSGIHFVYGDHDGV